MRPGWACGWAGNRLTGSVCGNQYRRPGDRSYAGAVYYRGSPLTIRPAVPDDAPAVVALRAIVYPYLVRGVESTRAMIADPPPGEDWIGYVAEAGGEVVGWASAFRNITSSQTDFGEIALLHVHPERRGGGFGGALLAATTDHLRSLGVNRIRAWAQTGSLDFARRHGYEPSREMRLSALDLRPAPPYPTPPVGVRLLSAAEVDPHVIYAADAAASVDEPGDVPVDAMSYETWRYSSWDNPGLDKEASAIALVGDEVVAFSMVKRDGERMFSDFTGTLPAYRGRGLAGLVKRAALSRAAERGVTVAYTSNDEENAPMLAVNKRLGYRPVAAEWSCLSTLG